MRTSITIFPVSRRRRLRRNRALARALWFRFSKQQIRLTRQQLRWIQGTLAAHHSRDVSFLQAISRAMSQFRLEESYPWRCQCSRLNKKSHDHCPQCKRHWTTGRRHETQPAAYSWYTEEEQQWKEWESPRQGRQKQKPARSKSLRAKKGKGKGSYGVSEPPQLSPFANPAMIPPWPMQDTGYSSGQPATRSQTSLATVGSAASGSMQAPPNDLLLAIRKEYPDISKAPQHVREAVEKEEAANSQRIGADLQKTSSQINKASKQLNQLREARRRHREQWLRHLKDSIAAWESQMKAFQEQQKQYIEQTNKAKAELSAARRNLQALNKLAGLQTSVKAENMPEAQEMEEGLGESEATEAALTKQVQDCLKQAASIINPTDVHDIMDSEEEESNGAPKSKRQRSLEPFGHQAPIPVQTPGALDGTNDGSM